MNSTVSGRVIMTAEAIIRPQLTCMPSKKCPTPTVSVNF